MVRVIAAAAVVLLESACAGGDDAVDDLSPSAPDDANMPTGAVTDGPAVGGATPAPDVTVAAYEQVEILPLWASSLGETEVDDGSAAGPLSSLGFAGELPGGSDAVLVPLYVRNGSKEDIDVRDAVDAVFVTAGGEEFGAEAGCGTFTGAYDDGAVIEWAEDGTVWVCRVVPEGEAAGGMWRVSALPDGGRTYDVAVP